MCPKVSFFVFLFLSSMIFIQETLILFSELAERQHVVF